MHSNRQTTVINQSREIYDSTPTRFGTHFAIPGHQVGLFSIRFSFFVRCRSVGRAVETASLVDFCIFNNHCDFKITTSNYTSENDVFDEIFDTRDLAKVNTWARKFLLLILDAEISWANLCGLHHSEKYSDS